MKTQNFFFLFSTSMQEKEEEKKIWKTTKAPGESKTLQQFKTQITQICLSVCLSVCTHSFHLLVNPRLVGKSTPTARAAKELNPLSFAASWLKGSGLWKCTMQRVNGMGRIAATADSSYPLQQLRKAGSGRHTALDYQNRTQVTATPLVLLNSPFFAKLLA